MTFAAPWVLLLLLLVPVLVYFGASRRGGGRIAFPGAADAAAVPPSAYARLHALMPWLRVLAAVALVAALARPQWGFQATKLYKEGIAIAMVVDISSSMGALDLKIDEQERNRLDVVKETFRAFVTGDDDQEAGREGDMIGLVSFARYPDALSSLTLDHDALLELLGHLRIVSGAEEDGTAIGDGIVLGLETLREANASSRVMILLTDGSNNAGDTMPLQAAQLAQALGIRIYAIGAGTRGVAMMPQRVAGGGTVIVPQQVYIDEDSLMQIAQRTGGRYFRATDAEGLRAIYGEIDRMERSETVSEHFQSYVEWFPLPVSIALLLLTGEAMLRTTRLRTVP